MRLTKKMVVGIILLILGGIYYSRNKVKKKRELIFNPMFFQRENLSHVNISLDQTDIPEKSIYCFHNVEDCSYGIQIALRVEEGNHVEKMVVDSKKIYIRKAGLPEWIEVFFHHEAEQCKDNCKLIDFNDMTIKAHASLKHQGLVRQESHEVQIFANLEAHSHESILECLESKDLFCWHASFFLKSRIPITYSFLTYSKSGLDVYNSIRNGMKWCNHLNDRSKGWNCLFNSVSRSKNKVNKTNSNMGVGFVSATCNRHNNFYSRLMKIVKIDMMGSCMKNRDEDEFNVFNEQILDSLWWNETKDVVKSRDLKKILIASKYKFLISIENTIMEDYVTEKFWAGFLADTVMVYLGAPNADMYAPAAHSFINVMHYSSVESLGRHLLYLSETPHEYNRYFEWRKANSISKGFLSHVYENYDNPPLCKVCSQLRWFFQNQTAA